MGSRTEPSGCSCPGDVLAHTCPGPCTAFLQPRGTATPFLPSAFPPPFHFFSFPPSVHSSGGCQVPGQLRLPSLPVPDFAPFLTEIPGVQTEGFRSHPGVSCARVTVPGAVWGPQGGGRGVCGRNLSRASRAVLGTRCPALAGTVAFFCEWRGRKRGLVVTQAHSALSHHRVRGHGRPPRRGGWTGTPGAGQGHPGLERDSQSCHHPAVPHSGVLCTQGVWFAPPHCEPTHGGGFSLGI